MNERNRPSPRVRLQLARANGQAQNRLCVATVTLSELNHPARACPICAEATREVLHRQRFAEFSSEGLLAGYDVVACSHCGFCFGDRIPAQDAFDRYYQTMSKYESAPVAAATTDPERHRLVGIAPFIESAAPSDWQILEIGCASGQLLDVLRGRGFSRVRGVDPSPACSRIARECYGIPVEVGTFSSLQTSESEADLVVLIGVLEHVCDLTLAMLVLRQLVPVGRRVFVTVPDASRYPSGVDAPYQEFSVEHINYFGPASLENLMQLHGFEPVFCEPSTVEPSLCTSTPVIHAAFTRCQDLPGPAGGRVRPDRDTASSLREYVAKSEREHQTVLPVLEDLAGSQRPLVVWGAGAHTLRLLATSPLGEANILAIIDSNPRYQGKCIGRVPIISPRQRPDESATVLISSRAYQEQICRQVSDRLGWKNPIITLY